MSNLLPPSTFGAGQEQSDTVAELFLPTYGHESDFISLAVKVVGSVHEHALYNMFYRIIRHTVYMLYCIQITN